MLDPQEVFDREWDWFIIQNQPFGNGYVSCKFRGTNGSRCAIGLLIPDEDYKESLESTPLNHFAADFGWGVKILPLLVSLMSAHDDCSLELDAKVMLAKRFRNIAIEFCLTVPSC